MAKGVENRDRVIRVLSGAILLCLIGCATTQVQPEAEQFVSAEEVLAQYPELIPSLRAPRPDAAPERLDFRPKLRLRDSEGVRRALHIILGPRRSFVEDVFQRYPEYQEIFEEAFSEYDLPLEMAHLAMLESRLDPKARSPRGAAGLWQFMPATAKRYGLTINRKVDQRFDVVRSTQAAAKYLNKLYVLFDDWLLVVAAYNCGPSALAKIIKEEQSADFFVLAERGRLSKETVRLVERFIALSMISRNKEAYGF